MSDQAETGDGYILAGRLGLEAFYDERGDDGGAYFLEDGRIMKVTTSAVEAAVALALMDAQWAGATHPSIPRIDDLRWLIVDADLSTAGLPDLQIPVFVIIRESFDDFPDPMCDEHLCQDWGQALRHLNYGWRENCPANTAAAARAWAGHGPALEQLLSGLEWLKASAGIQVLDIRPDNAGLSQSGTVGMRDLGRAVVPQYLLDRVKALDFAPMPDAVPMAQPGL